MYHKNYTCTHVCCTCKFEKGLNWRLTFVHSTGLWMLHSAALQTVWGVHERSTNYSFITSNSIVHVTPFNHNGSTCTEHVHVHTCMCTCTLTKHWSGFMTTCKEPPILNGRCLLDVWWEQVNEAKLLLWKTFTHEEWQRLKAQYQTHLITTQVRVVHVYRCTGVVLLTLLTHPQPNKRHTQSLY